MARLRAVYQQLILKYYIVVLVGVYYRHISLMDIWRTHWLNKDLLILNYFQIGFAIIFYLSAHIILVPVLFLLWIIAALIETRYLNIILIEIIS